MHSHSQTISADAIAPSYRPSRPLAWRVVGVQLLVTQSIALSLLAFGQSGPALAASAGGWIAVLPNALFVLWAFRSFGAQAARSIAKDFYVGEALKMAATVLGFVIAFKAMGPAHAGWLFGAFVAGLSVYWISPWILSAGKAR